MTFNDQHVLLIGGSTGIGFATAERLVRRGARVTLASRNQARLQAAGSKLGGARTETVDVTDEAHVQALFERVGPIDHLVYTAASAYLGPLSATPDARFRELVESKLFGATLVVKHGAPRLRPGGTVTLFSGIVTRKPLPGSSAFAAAGAATEAAARVWAVEYAPIRVNCIVPGIIDTDVWAGLMSPEDKQAHFDAVAQQLPLGRIGRADEVARAVEFLIECGFITGETIAIDGGHQLV